MIAAGKRLTCKIPVWSLTSEKTSPPMFLCLCTHPQRVAVLPTSFSVSLPHKSVLAGHERVERSSVCLSRSPAVASADAPTEPAVLAASVEQQQEPSASTQGAVRAGQLVVACCLGAMTLCKVTGRAYHDKCYEVADQA